MNLNLTRPLIVFDLETTGVNVGKDRIVEIALLKIFPDGTEKARRHLVNPGIPIPNEAYQIHGISNENVKNEPYFRDLAGDLIAFIDNSDLAGYNSLKFDVPLLVEEFLRAGFEFDLKNRYLVDVQNIFHKMEPRTLKAAYKFYCAQELINAHSAEADTQATYEILKAQLDRYENVEYTEKEGVTSVPVVNNIKSLSTFSTYHQFADLVGHLALNDKGEEVFNFGKYKNRLVSEVFTIEPSYYDWMMKSDFPLSTKKVITAVKMRDFGKK